MNASLLRSKITRYFNQCQSEGTPPTPAGLALALDTRTSELTQAPLDGECRRLIDRALQRIEAETLDLLLSKSAARGLEIILQNTSKCAVPDRLSGLTDDELDERLIRLARRIAALADRENGEKEALQ